MNATKNVSIVVLAGIVALAAAWFATRAAVGRGSMSRDEGTNAPASVPLRTDESDVAAGIESADERRREATTTRPSGETDVGAPAVLVLALRDEIGAPIAMATAVVLDAAS